MTRWLAKAARPQNAAVEGKVVAVSIDGKHRFSKTPQLSITLVEGQGVQGDAHFGTHIKHRYLARWKPRAPNHRQVHLISSELFDELLEFGYDVGPGDLGENIATVGLELEGLPLDTELRIGASAGLRLTGLRTPCVLIDRFKAGLKARLVTNRPGPPFRAGVMAVVSRSGDVYCEDAIRVLLPAASHRPLPPI